MAGVDGRYTCGDVEIVFTSYPRRFGAMSGDEHSGSGADAGAGADAGSGADVGSDIEGGAPAELMLRDEHRTFVLVHGIGMGRLVFTEVADRLRSAGRVIALDLPGFGDSPEPGSFTPIEATAENLADFIRAEAPAAAAGGSIVLLGHSMGTQIVAELAVRYPAMTEAMVLIAPTVNRYERTAWKQAMRMLQDLWGEGQKVLFTGVWEYLKTSPLWFANKLRFMLGHRIERLCERITVPTLVLRGETDRVCPRGWVSEVAAAIPNAQMEEIPDRGHEAIIKSPEPVASMVLKFVVK